MPDVYLTLADIAASERKTTEKIAFENRFIETVDKPEYEGMYNKYLISLFAERPDQLARAKELAEQEVKNRATPETWSWLAWVLFRAKDYDGALTILNNYVHNRTFDPEVLYRMAQVYDVNNKKDDAVSLLRSCAESAFELGPEIEKKIKERLIALNTVH